MSDDIERTAEALSRGVFLTELERADVVLR